MSQDILFIGVDGGGTRCRARLRDRGGRLLGEAEAGPANARLGQAAIAEIHAACRRAVEAAGLPPEMLARAHAGLALAGVAQPADLDFVLGQAHPFASVQVDTDAYAAFLGAHGERDGAILILGTGSCGLAVVGGERFNVGGWGAEISDEASGMAIGREALRRALWALEGMAPMGTLAEEVLAAFGRDPAQAVAFGDRARPADFARFAPLVFRHAEARDRLAIAILKEAAADAERLLTRLLDLGAPAVCLMGGIAPLLEPWLAPPFRARIAAPQGDALEGALALARRAAPAGAL